MSKQLSIFPPIPDSVDLPRSIAPASLESWHHILETLQERECQVLLALFDAMDGLDREDFTGGELADWSGISILHVRPRLTGLKKKRLVDVRAMRNSRVKGEARCEPFYPTVPKSAVERWQSSLKK